MKTFSFIILYSIFLGLSSTSDATPGTTGGGDASLRTLPKATLTFGAIPDQAVWHGDTNEFLLGWTGSTPVSYTMEAFPSPAGSIKLAPSSESNWFFQYVPDLSDKTSFTVTIAASAGGQRFSQSFLITPQPSLPPEQTVFGTDRHTQPGAVTSYGTTNVTRESLLPKELNYQNNKVISVRIVGETVEIQPGHTNRLYETYFSSDDIKGRRDIQDMEIIAEKVIIRSPLRLKQTDMTIFARELRFEGAGQIKTTPEEITTMPNTSQAGKDGLRAGNVTLHLGKLSFDTPGLKFDLVGGKGQNGGPGQAGVDGADNPNGWYSMKRSVSLLGSVRSVTYTPPAGYLLIYWYLTDLEITIDRGGTDKWPTDGTDALPSGKPGEGGSGGSLISTCDLTGLYSNQGGASGKAPRTGSSYTGGAAGSPEKSARAHFYVYYTPYSLRCATAGTHETKAGTNAPVLQPKSSAGQTGSARLAGSTNSWLHPLLLRKVMAHAKDDYLGSRIDEAETRLKDYVSAINAGMADTNYWAGLDPTVQYELEQMYNEMQILLQRIANGLDYFGNPAGWVPMLSFEVNTTLFDNEIDRAIDILYLAYWIKHKAASEQQKVNALSAARDKLRDEIAQAKLDYDAAVIRLPVLKNKALTLQNQIIETQMALQTKEQELLKQTGDPDWVTGVRLGLKVSAMICQMIPVYQPALGAVGSGLRLASNIKPDAPWDTIVGGTDITTTYLKSEYESAAQAQQNKSKGIDPNSVESKQKEYLGGLRSASTGLSTGLSDIRGFLASMQAPSADMLVELERLKSESPECKNLVQKVEDLVVEKRKFTDELITTMQAIATLSDLITRNILAIDALNRDITPGLTVLDERASAYLGDMESRAYERLLKYHYYMAKAYEYRLLQPYTAPLDLQGLLAKFEEIADLNADQSITVEQFNTLKSVFKEKLRIVAETIFDRYNSTPPDTASPRFFALTPDELARLNRNETVVVNLVREGRFFPYEENARIINVAVAGVTIAPVGGTWTSASELALFCEHSGISNLKLDGAVHQFRHYNRLTKNPIVWEARYYPYSGGLSNLQISAASDSLLRSLLSGDAVSDMLLYSRPAAWADLRIRREIGGPVGIDITALQFVMNYDFTRRSAPTTYRNLDVAVTTALPAGEGHTVTNRSSITPYFIVTPDVNDRQDARGQFLRIYYDSEQVSVTAQADYGGLVFAKWTDWYGRDLPGGPHTSSILHLTMSDDQAVCAQYVPLTSVPRSLSQPIFSSLGDAFTLSWNGSGKLRLQATASLTPPVNWQDVPGSESRSIIELPKTNRAMFFRLILP